MDAYGIPQDSDREYANTLMWAHYANFHSGFCIKYVLPSSFTSQSPNDEELIMLRPIKYVETFPLKDYLGLVKNDISFYDALLTKQKKWEYEHEHRIIYFNRKGSPDYAVPKLPERSIKAVYIGVKTTDENKKKLIEAIKDRPEIEIYQMKISDGDIYKLLAERVNN